ncbi:MAG: EexN family lipoprotein [Neisseriaceae bacterium]|nr:MAG: EexN family lipoprotein [Neisseriaceae bacterium]
MKGKKMKKLSFLLVICMLTACSTKEKIYSMDEFRKDEALIKKVLKECSEMSFNDQLNSTNCARADEAQSEIDLQIITGKRRK